MTPVALDGLIKIKLLRKDETCLFFEEAWLPAYLNGEQSAGEQTDDGGMHLSGRWGPKAVLGVTGNIAVGKSTVLGMLADLGAEIIDADQLVHVLREPGRPGYEAIRKMFGPTILLPDKHIDTRQLSERAFRDKAVLKQLEQVFRPLVVAEVIRLGSASPSPVVVVEALYLVDGTLKDQVDSVWVVDAPQERQIERLVTQRGLTREQAVRRIELQHPQADKLAQADQIIQNDAAVAATWAQVIDGWWQVLNGLYRANWLTDDLLRQCLQVSLERAGVDLEAGEAFKALRQISAAMGADFTLPLTQIDVVIDLDLD